MKWEKYDEGWAMPVKSWCADCERNPANGNILPETIRYETRLTPSDEPGMAEINGTDLALKSGETKLFDVPLDQYTDTVINEMGERCKVKHYTLYAGICQPDELSVKLTGVLPVEIKK